PGVGAIWMAPALRVGIDKLRFVSQDIGGGFGNKITLHPQFTVCCLLARKLNRPVQWTEWRTDQHTANTHGNERTFLDVTVPVKADGTMLGFSVRAIDDCGAFPRYEPLGCIIWAQVTPGCYRWRSMRVDFTQVCTNKSPVAPNRGYSRMQHLWLTERIVDIVAGELGLDPIEVRKRNYVKHEEFPYETPNGCIYDSGDYARCLDIALDLIGYDSRDEVNVRPGDDTYWNSTAGFPGKHASQFAVTVLVAVKAATEKLAVEMKQLAAAVFGCSPDDIELVESQARIKGNPEAALPFMA